MDGVTLQTIRVSFNSDFDSVSSTRRDDACCSGDSGQVLVPIDATDTNYDVNTVPDFWEQVGRNTEYVFAPEECLADNFSYAITYGLDGKEYKTPELIQKIITTLQMMKIQ